jgi:uncharacterized membrane protein
MTSGRTTRSSPERHPLVARYVEQLEGELVRSGIPREEIIEIVADIDGHFADAQSVGRSLSSTLERLGAVRELAHAYTVALAVGVGLEGGGSAGRPRTGRDWLRRATEVGRLATLASLTLVIGGLGVALLLTGVVGALAALVLPFVPSRLLDPTLRAGLPQLVVLAVAALSAAVGRLSLRLAKLNLRSLLLGVRRLRRARPDRVATGQTDSDRRLPSEHGSPHSTVHRPAIETWQRR